MRSSWHEAGFANLGRILDPAALTTLRGACREIASRSDPIPSTSDRPGPGDPTQRVLEAKGYGLLRHNVSALHPAFPELLRASALPVAVLEVLGVDEIVLFQDHLVWKPPGTEVPLAWHQDFGYWPISAPLGVTVWLTLDDADGSNGCLHYVPGSHLWGERRAASFVSDESTPLGEKTSTDPSEEGLAPIDVPLANSRARAVPLAAGDALLHHPLVWHMSPANRSTRDRRAWSLTFLLPEALWDPDHAPHPYNFELSPRPGTPVGELRFPVFRR